jgi:hypothetical protein
LSYSAWTFQKQFAQYICFLPFILTVKPAPEKDFLQPQHSNRIAFT